MRKSLLFFLCAVSIVAASCGGGKPGEEFGMKDQAAIRERTDAFVKAFNNKDVAQVLTIYSDASTFMPPNQPIIRGRDALKTFFDELFKSGASNLQLNVAEVSGSGPLAYQHGTYEMDIKPANGSSTRDRGKYLFVLRRVADTWRFEYTMWNSDLPASGN